MESVKQADEINELHNSVAVETTETSEQTVGERGKMCREKIDKMKMAILRAHISVIFKFSLVHSKHFLSLACCT